MYARVNYVDIKPELFDECDDFWRDVISRYPGMELGYFLQDGDTAHTLSFIFFEDEVAMQAHNDGEFAEVLRQASRFRLCDPDLHPMDVCAMLPPARPADAGYARVTDVGFDPTQIDAAVAQWLANARPYAEEPGFVGAYLCCDRSSGTAKSVSFWQSKSDIDANESSGGFGSAIAASADVVATAHKYSYWRVRVVV